MPTVRYKLYQYPRYKSRKTVYQDDVMDSFLICKNCQCMVEAIDNKNKNIFTR